MTQFNFYLEFEAENVTTISRTPQHKYIANADCTKCGHAYASVQFSPDDTSEIPNSRGTANLCISCPFCQARSSLNFLKEGKATASGDLLAVIEVRGPFRPLAFGLTGWRAESASGATFDCYQAELAEWDDEIQGDVVVYDLKGSVK
ncbi:hypothetical protein SS50377_25088 [Spironucleus salmonicida]|uniref:Uncharacterized protein n=1 Tax=Spironucleus salmonicida TaxID=348837 RepID=V6LF93_9EUKA|nr:hypothetical protein SS50377_25088 [Spironucleus salmonicida]|eukprot:EST42958.1 Hypothetical protein SS50377_17407 [Spironucleus salmonicida]